MNAEMIALTVADVLNKSMLKNSGVKLTDEAVIQLEQVIEYTGLGWKCPECGDMMVVAYDELAVCGVPMCGECDLPMVQMEDEQDKRPLDNQLYPCILVMQQRRVRK